MHVFIIVAVFDAELAEARPRHDLKVALDRDAKRADGTS
jgi:hypothetical protein